MIEGESRYPKPILEQNDLISAIKENPSDIFEGITRGILDLRELAQNSQSNLFHLRRMQKLATAIEHGTIGAIIPSEDGMTSHLGYPYRYTRHTVEKKSDSEKKELLAQRTIYTFVKTNDMPPLSNAMFRLAETVAIEGLKVADATVGIKIIQYHGAGLLDSAIDFYKITTARAGRQPDIIVTIRYPGDDHFQQELQEGFQRRYLSGK